MKRAALLVTIIFLAIIAGLLMPWLISSIQIDDQLCDLPIIVLGKKGSGAFLKINKRLGGDLGIKYE